MYTYENAILEPKMYNELYANKVTNFRAGRVAHTLIPASGMQRQAGLFEFKDSLVFLRSSRTAKATK